MLISAVITILEDFGSLLPARTVTVKVQTKRKGHLRSFQPFEAIFKGHFASKVTQDFILAVKVLSMTFACESNKASIDPVQLL